MYTPEDHQKHVRRARTTFYQHQIRLLCITLLPVEDAGQSRATHLPCAAWALEANVGHSPAARPELEQHAVTMLFLQLNPWSSEERNFIFNYLRWCFTWYTALRAKFVISLSKLHTNILCFHKFSSHLFFLNGYICTNQTDKIYYNRRHYHPRV